MKVIAIDWDGTASIYPEKVNKLHDDPNNLIIIYTARPEALRERTLEEMARAKLRFDTLVMGKLRADVYIDDKNVGGLQWTGLGI